MRNKVYQREVDDCFRCAIASVLDVSRASVPDLRGRKSWAADLDAWLRPRGMFTYRFTGLVHPLGDRAIAEWLGIVDRNGHDHAVVLAADMLGRVSIVHDPAGDVIDPDEPIERSIIFARVDGDPWIGY
jgi:hypothetical protein